MSIQHLSAMIYIKKKTFKCNEYSSANNSRIDLKTKRKIKVQREKKKKGKNDKFTCAKISVSCVKGV
jgi:hypothetical protein